MSRKPQALESKENGSALQLNAAEEKKLLATLDAYVSKKYEDMKKESQRKLGGLLASGYISKVSNQKWNLARALLACLQTAKNTEDKLSILLSASNENWRIETDHDKTKNVREVVYCQPYWRERDEPKYSPQLNDFFLIADSEKNREIHEGFMKILKTTSIETIELLYRSKNGLVASTIPTWPISASSKLQEIIFDLFQFYLKKLQTESQLPFLIPKKSGAMFAAKRLPYCLNNPMCSFLDGHTLFRAKSVSNNFSGSIDDFVHTQLKSIYSKIQNANLPPFIVKILLREGPCALLDKTITPEQIIEFIDTFKQFDVIKWIRDAGISEAVLCTDMTIYRLLVLCKINYCLISFGGEPFIKTSLTEAMDFRGQLFKNINNPNYFNQIYTALDCLITYKSKLPKGPTELSDIFSLILTYPGKAIRKATALVNLFENNISLTKELFYSLLPNYSDPELIVQELLDKNPKISSKHG